MICNSYNITIFSLGHLTINNFDDVFIILFHCNSIFTLSTTGIKSNRKLYILNFVFIETMKDCDDDGVIQDAVKNCGLNLETISSYSCS